MSDWLDKIQQQKEQDRLEEERQIRLLEEEYLNSPMGIGVRRNGAKIKRVYERLANELNRAVEIGGFFLRIKDSGLNGDHVRGKFSATCGSTDKDHWYGELRCDYGPLEPLRILTLYVDNDTFKICFVWHSRPSGRWGDAFYHDWHDEQIPITKVDDNYVSNLIRWLATGQPEFQSPSSSPARPKGLFGRLFS